MHLLLMMLLLTCIRYRVGLRNGNAGSCMGHWLAHVGLHNLLLNHWHLLASQVLWLSNHLLCDVLLLLLG